MIDPGLKQWANPRQLEILEAIELHGSHTAAGKALGLSRWAVDRVVKAVKQEAARHGYAPSYGYTHPVAPGFKAKRISQFLDSDGNVSRQWVIGEADDAYWKEAQQAALEAMQQTLQRVAQLPAPKDTQTKLCNLYTLTDCHVGMLAWHQEGGADWSLEIAEESLIGAMAHMIAASPKARVAFINQLGDFLHYDSALAPTTPASGHIVDAAGRYSQMVAAAIRILRKVIDMALQHHEEVVLVLAEGNHDITSSVWLRHMFAALYEREPRITVIDSELPYYVHQHGQTMLGFHHGHLRKPQELPLLFAAQYPQIWGATTKRYSHIGHRHHYDEKEYAGMTVVQHSTLAAKDSYASRGGWFSERQIRAMTYHEDHGLVAVNVVTPEMLEELV